MRTHSESIPSIDQDEDTKTLTITKGGLCQNKGTWFPQDIGGGVILHGFFKLSYGIEKKSKKPFCRIDSLSRLNIKAFLNESGFRKKYSHSSKSYKFIHVHDSVMDLATIDSMRGAAQKELESQFAMEVSHNDVVTGFTIEFMLTKYYDNQGMIFNSNFLELLEEYTVEELSDTRNESYFLFNNGIIKATKEGSVLIPYHNLSELNKCVWKSHIMERTYNPDCEGVSEFEKFIINVSNAQEQRINAFKSAIGYLLHNHNGSHMGQAIICYDEEPTDNKNPKGGTGKGLFGQAFPHMREVCKIDGKIFDHTSQFRFQLVSETSQLVFVEDLRKEVPFDTFFSCLSDGWTIEQKGQKTIKIKPENSPKMLFSTNTVIEGRGTSHLRRMFIIEFSNHYSKKIKLGNETPIEDEHNGLFFDPEYWKANEWDIFTKYMVQCLSYYLKNKLQPYELINVSKNVLIQTSKGGEDFIEFIEEKNIQLLVEYPTKDLFEAYKERYYGADSNLGQRTFSNDLKKYGDSKGWVIKQSTNSATKISYFSFRKK